MQWRVPLVDLAYGDEEKQAVLKVLDSHWLTMGGVTQQFEKEFARFVGAEHAVAVSNATVALHLACLAAGLGPGDEVIAPSLTFVATANAVLYTGAQVRFADIISETDLTLSPQAISALIGPRTKAIIVMHYAGFPCKMQAILEIASQHGLAVIEDAAHAAGAWLDGKHLGVWGDVGCFSFFSNKNLATGEGGMIVTNRSDLAEKARLLRSHAMTSVTWDRHQGRYYTYDVVELGYNYRIDEIRSALGLAQLEKLEVNNARRRAITRRYWDGLKNAGLVLPFHASDGAPGIIPSCHIFPCLLPAEIERTRFIDAMRSEGIQTSIHYPPVHQLTYYEKKYSPPRLPITETAASREVTLPLFPTMSDEQIEQVMSGVKASLATSLGGGKPA